MINETDLINWLRQRVPPGSGVRLGIGDDAALLAPGVGEVLTVDMLMDGVDFRLGEVDAQRIGRKALAVNLSDLAAMGAWPRAVLVALALPRDNGFELAKSLYDGMLPLLEKYHIALVGGDTNSWTGPLVISITAIGNLEGRKALTRGGAKPGDQLLVTGDLGGSILGKHFDFEPRLAEARYLAEHLPVSAAMDLSDGLSVDLCRLCEASGCGAELWLDQLPLAPAAIKLAAQDGRSAIDHALGDGEDFELLIALPRDAAEELLTKQPLRVHCTRVGECSAERGIWQRMPGGKRAPLTVQGYLHSLEKS